ncbi:MAG: hypothetical protein ABIG99_01220 [Patescibacteria group bacterium]
MKKTYNEKLLQSLANKLEKPEKYIREQISKRAGSLGVLPETYFILWLIENKIPITRYLKNISPELRNDVQQNRSLLLSRIVRKTQTPKVIYSKQVARKVSTATLKTNIQQLFSPTDAYNSSRNSGYYGFIYFIENSTRKFIEYFLEKEYGKNWWSHSMGQKAVVRRKIRDDVKYIKKIEEDNPIYDKRGVHELNYTDFTQLATIIEDNKSVFDPVCISLAGKSVFISQILNRLAPVRNNVAHMGTTSKKDATRLKVDYQDMFSAYKSISEKVINRDE